MADTMPTVAELEEKAVRMVDTALHLAVIFGVGGCDGIGGHLGCGEAEALADFLRAYDYGTAADTLLEDHKVAESDIDWKEGHTDG